jgi:cell wall-associated NlpC family hydrolase
MDKKLDDLVRKLLAVPYLHRGRDYNGADCGGMILLFYRDYRGITLPDIADYDKYWGYKGKNYFIEDYHKLFYPVTVPQLGDVVLFHNGKGISDHGGVALRGGNFLHCHRYIGASIDRYGALPWSKSFSGFYRYIDG